MRFMPLRYQLRDVHPSKISLKMQGMRTSFHPSGVSVLPFSRSTRGILLSMDCFFTLGGLE